MFDKFGEFDSVAEINNTAKRLLEEGNTEEVKELAAENGISKEDAEDYIDGITDTLATPLMAAIGKLDLEHKEYEIDGILQDWEMQVREMCMQEDVMRDAVRRKGKSLRDCMAELIAFSFKNKKQVSNKIASVTKVEHNGKTEPIRTPLYLGAPTRKDAKIIIKDYYLR